MKKMHQQARNVALSFILVVMCSILPLSQGGTMKALPPFGTPFGTAFGGWSAPTVSTSTGISGLAALQQGDAGHTLSLNASGQGMAIGLVSNTASDGYTNLAQSGGNSAGSSAEVNNSTGTSEILPQSTVLLEILNSDDVAVVLDSHALGSEQVDSVVEQQAHVTSGQQSAVGWQATPTVAPSGWVAPPPTMAPSGWAPVAMGGWEASTPTASGGWGVSLQGGKN